MAERRQQDSEALRDAGFRPTHPGVFFGRRVVADRGLGLPAVAAELGLSDWSLIGFMNGEERVDENLAERLAAFCGTTPRFWLNMQEAADGSIDGSHIGWQVA